MKEVKRKLNRFFRTHANYHVLTQNWKFRFHMWFVNLTNE